MNSFDPVPANDDPIAASAVQLCTAGVDLGGLMTVLGRHLYSTPVVALRELVQNAHDSIIRRRIEQPSWHDEARITVQGDVTTGTITVTDSGAGLTDHEIHAFLATVGVGYTRTLREQGEKTGLIGMFGLGFLSAFVLSKRVTVETTSYQAPEQGWRYRSTNGEQYTLEKIPARPVGATVTLELRDDFLHLAGDGLLKQALQHYCILLREPVFIGEEEKSLNPEPPPWRQTDATIIEHPVQVRRKRLEFAARFEHHFEPICTVPVTPGSESDAIGLLWVQDGATYGNSDNRNLSVFVRGMLLDDDARDLLPSWAGFVGGVIESERLTPTASREDLQRDEHYDATRRALSEALISGLADIAHTQPEAWRRVLSRHNEALLGAALCDERLFDLLANDVRIPTSQGDMLVRGLRSSGGTMHVMLGSQGGFEDMLFRALRVPVARGDRYAVVPFLRKWAIAYGGVLIELGTEAGNLRLFTPAHLPADEVNWLEQMLGAGETVVAARFSPAELPLVAVPDREAELKRRLENDEADKRISVAALRLVRNFTQKIDDSVLTRLYVNLDNPAIQSLLTAYRAGSAGVDEAVCLLRALKIVIAASGESQETLDLNGALADICRIIAHRLTPDTTQ